MIQITQVPREEVPAIWSVVGPMIDRAIEYTAHRVELIDVYADILLKNMMLWIAFNEENEIVGCAVTRVYETPLTRCLTFEYLAGDDIDTWLDEGDVMLNSYAFDMQCEWMDCRGRFGWVPRLKNLGWESKAVFFEKKVIDPKKVRLPQDEEEGY